MAGTDAGRSDETPAELKSGQFPLMVLKLRQLDLHAVGDFLADQVAAAPRLLTGAPVVLDLAPLDVLPDAAQFGELLRRVRFCGLHPIALIAEADSATALLGEAVGLPAVAAERKRQPRPDGGVAEPTPAPLPIPPAAAPAPRHPQRHGQPIRSGQQVYARGNDLVVTATVSAGAEVIADGSVHVYGRLSGKALAGARGDAEAHIYCLAFDAELVSIAGRFRVFETVPAEIKGRPCHLFLSGDRLEIQPLG